MTANHSIQIRRASVVDAPSIAEIYKPFVLYEATSFEIEPPDSAEIAARIAKTQERGFPYIVAVIDEAVAGYAYTSSFRARSAYSITVESSVYVHETFQRRGVGRTLMRELMQASKETGKQQMIAVIADPQNNQPSIALHASLGFQEVGVLTGAGVKFGRAWDVLMLQLALDSTTGEPSP